jgi:hypothetical protein
MGSNGVVSGGSVAGQRGEFSLLLFFFFFSLAHTYLFSLLLMMAALGIGNTSVTTVKDVHCCMKPS